MRNTNFLTVPSIQNGTERIGHKGVHRAKKIVATVTAVLCAAAIGATRASAEVNTGEFITTAGTVLKTVIILIGAGLGVWGVVNLIEGYGNDNPGAKSQGMKQLMAGLALIALGVIMVPVLVNMMSDAMS